MIEQSCGPTSEDRALLVADDRSGLILVTDGAGGLQHGGEAAELVVRTVEAAWRAGALTGPDAVERALRRADTLAHEADGCGQTTAVAIVIAGNALFGASVGDSEAWLATEQAFVALTRAQQARPLLGSGDARPVGFRRDSDAPGALVVATDGLFRRAPAWRVCEIARTLAADEACAALAALARLPDGRLADDLSLVIVRLGPTSGGALAPSTSPRPDGPAASQSQNA